MASICWFVSGRERSWPRGSSPGGWSLWVLLTTQMNMPFRWQSSQICTGLLTELGHMPEKVTNPDWLRTLERENAGIVASEHQQTPSEHKAEQARATRRRAKKTETMRELRAGLALPVRPGPPPAAGGRRRFLSRIECPRPKPACRARRALARKNRLSDRSSANIALLPGSGEKLCTKESEQ